MRTRRVVAALALCMAVVCAGASLGEEIPTSGESIIVGDPPQETVLPSGEKHLQLDSRQVLLPADRSHPFHRVAMSCPGTCRVGADGGAPSCAGGCTGQDPDGDVINFAWTGFDEGTWTLVGGTGKWEGSTGSGTWKNAGPMGAGFSGNTWSGSIEMD